VQFDELIIPQRNRIQSAIRNLVKNKSEIDPEEVWVELGQGSLVVTMDVGATGSGEWPEMWQTESPEGKEPPTKGQADKTRGNQVTMPKDKARNRSSRRAG